MVVLNLGAAEQVGSVLVALVKLAGTIRSDNGENARRRFGARQVHRHDASFGNRRSQHIAVGGVGDHVMTFIGVSGRPRRL